MEMDKKRILIIPDVHGRDFWKKAVEETPCERIVFLGDYVDPYEREGITPEQALGVFFEVLDLKKTNPKKVVLLLGNHDMHYLSELFREMACGSRYDEDLSGIIFNLLNAQKKRFRLAHEEVVAGKRYLFTHAGVNALWYERHRETIKELTAKNLNHLMATKKGVTALADIGKIRGGYLPSGSMLWADSDEMLLSEPFPDVYQIFGHSQRSHPLITQHYACVDCRKAFLLDERGLTII